MNLRIGEINQGEAALDQPLISIIIPCYNAERWIARCLDSVTGQTYPALEIIVVSDGSTDGSDRIVRQFVSRDPRVRYVRQENQGVSAARNRGLSMATGEWVCFVDADDYVNRDHVHTMVSALASKEIDAVAVNFFMELPRGWRLPYPFIVLRKRLSGEQAVRQSFRLLFFPTFLWNKLFRRSLFTDHQISFPSILYEDAFVVPLLLLHCREVIVLKKACYHYVRHPGSLTHRVASGHVHDYLESAGMLRRHFVASGQWAKWEKPYGRWLNRIMAQIFFSLFLTKRTMPWKDRDRLIRNTRAAVKVIKRTGLADAALDELIFSA
jgi:glycosyltransferase involved in cell wall biosynthesis